MNSTLFLVDLDEMKSYLGFTDADADRDEQLGLFINLVSSLAEQYAERAFIEQEYTEYYNGPAGPVLALRHYPVTDDETTIDIREDVGRDFTDDTVVDSDDLFVNQEAGLITRVSWDWSAGRRIIKVVYSAGYTTIPYALRLSVMEGVAYFWKRKHEKSWGLNSISKGENSVTRFQTALPDTVKGVWDRYRRKSRV